MAEEASGQEKTEEPTSRRLQEARQKGDIAKSMEVPSAAVLLASLLVLFGFSQFLMERMTIMLQYYLGNLHSIELLPDKMAEVGRDGFFMVMVVCAPVMVAVFVVAIFSNVMQFGFMFTTEKLTPKFEKINPIQGFARLFSMQMMANTLKSIAKVTIIGYIAYREVVAVLPEIMPLMNQEPVEIMNFIGRVSFQIFLHAALFMIIIALADYAFQRYEFKKKMRMTKQEMKDEAKQTEGDPHVKGRIRSIQMEMARRRMMDEVPKADVIITNPVRLAVALRYDSMAMAAPMVVAKGAGVVAAKIKEKAKEHNIPVVEDKPLARALFKAVGINEAIPDNLFQAVAEVLAYVYSLKKRKAG